MYTLGLAHTLSLSLSLSLSLLDVVRGPCCVNQRKCRRSRGQAIHWSEYRLLSSLSFSSPFLSLAAIPHCLPQPLAFAALCVICTLRPLHALFVSLVSFSILSFLPSPGHFSFLSFSLSLSLVLSAWIWQPCVLCTLPSAFLVPHLSLLSPSAKNHPSFLLLFAIPFTSLSLPVCLSNGFYFSLPILSLTVLGAWLQLRTGKKN